MPAPKKITNKPTKEVLKRSENLKTKKRVGKIVIFLVITGIILSGLIYLLYLPALSIRSIFIQGNDILNTKDIESSIEETLAGKYFYFFPKKSILIYPAKTISEKLEQQFPRILSLEVGVGDYDSLVVNIKERDSDVIWCKDDNLPHDVLGQTIEDDSLSSSSPKQIFTERENLSSQNCYFSDNMGFIFAPAPYFSNNVFLELSGFLADEPLATKPLPLSSYTVVTHFAKNLAKIFAKTDYNEYRLIKIAILDNNNYEALIADTSDPDNGRWKIFFDNDDSAEDLTSNLFTILNSDPFKKEMTLKKGKLASIDLRYGKKVFYRFKE